MPEHCCDYTRPGVEPWWATGTEETQAEGGVGVRPHHPCDVRRQPAITRPTT